MSEVIAWLSFVVGMISYILTDVQTGTFFMAVAIFWKMENESNRH